MSEWKKLKLKEIAELRSEKFTPNNITSYPYIGLEHIEPKSLRINGIGVSNDVSSQKSIFYSDDILYGKLRPYFQKVYYSTFKGVCSTDIFVVKSKNVVHPKYLFYLLASDEFTALANQGSTGTRMPRADWKHLASTEWDIPDLPTQTAIAEILSSLDDKIELNNKINQELENLAQTLFKRWFIDFEFPNENGEPYKSSGGEMVDSALGKIPLGWSIDSLDNIADFLNGLALQKFPPENEFDFLPVIKIKELRQKNTSNSDKASNKIPEKYIIQNGDILFSWSGSLMVDFWTDGNGALNQHLFKVTSNQYPKWYYYLWTKFHLIEFIKIAESKATTMGHIQRQHLSDAKVLIPNVINEFTLTFEPLITKLIDNRIENVELTNLRDTLLPKLISGELEVSQTQPIS